MNGIDMDKIADIINKVSDALEGTGFQVVGYDNTGLWLSLMIDKVPAEENQ